MTAPGLGITLNLTEEVVVDKTENTLSPQLKSNSIIQLVLQALYAIKPGKR